MAGRGAARAWRRRGGSSDKQAQFCGRPKPAHNPEASFLLPQVGGGPRIALVGELGLAREYDDCAVGLLLDAGDAWLVHQLGQAFGLRSARLAIARLGGLRLLVASRVQF